MGHEHKIIFYSTLFVSYFFYREARRYVCKKQWSRTVDISLEFFIFCLCCVCDSSPMQEKAARIRSWRQPAKQTKSDFFPSYEVPLRYTTVLMFKCILTD